MIEDVASIGACPYGLSIAATGYRVDLPRPAFLCKLLRDNVRFAGGSPALILNLESAVPGLYFVGTPSANGPALPAGSGILLDMPLDGPEAPTELLQRLAQRHPAQAASCSK